VEAIVCPKNDPTETIPESERPGPLADTHAQAPAIGLVVLWSSDEPQFLGAWLPVPGSTTGQPTVLGRGSARGPNEAGRVVALRQRPGGNQPLPAFLSPSLSKTQLLLWASTAATLSVENVGRRRLSVNGRECEKGELRPGDIVDIGSQLTLICAVRPQTWEPVLVELHPFAEPDAHGFVGESLAAWRLRSEVRFVAPRVGHVLVHGTTGTGKELIAHAIHAESKRAGPLVARNAATLPEALVDAELFGNAKGYPNPGMAERKGMIGAADGGTLFLDEFADLPVGAQAHVLRVLDAGEYHRLGDDKARHSDFRLVAATNRPESDLRSDVLARFDFRITTPDLATRPEDIPLIALQLLRAMAKGDPELQSRFFAPTGFPRFSDGFVRRLVELDYGANVRELRQRLWQAVAASTGSELTWSAVEAATPAFDGSASQKQIEDISRERLERALDENNGSIEKTWRALGFSNRHVLNRLLRKHGLTVTKQHGRE
jgi:transcriptional regulator with AAA-type ATPase domain